MKVAGIKLRHDKGFGSYFGTTEPENYDTGKHHFEPKFRYVYVSSKCNSGTDLPFFYITSNIAGKMRRYRCWYWYETSIANIFASGTTLEEAIKKFNRNFSHKIYNTRK